MSDGTIRMIARLADATLYANHPQTVSGKVYIGLTKEKMVGLAKNARL